MIGGCVGPGAALAPGEGEPSGVASLPGRGDVSGTPAAGVISGAGCTLGGVCAAARASPAAVAQATANRTALKTTVRKQRRSVDRGSPRFCIFLPEVGPVLGDFRFAI